MPISKKNQIFQQLHNSDIQTPLATSPPDIIRQAQQIYGNNSVNFTAWQPIVWTVSDYYPFGMQMEERRLGVGRRFGFNGKEMDNEMKEEGNSLEVFLMKLFRVHQKTTNNGKKRYSYWC